MRDPYEVLDQKERELLQVRMDVAALYRVAHLLAEASDCLEALKARKES